MVSALYLAASRLFTRVRVEGISHLLSHRPRRRCPERAQGGDASRQRVGSSRHHRSRRRGTELSPATVSGWAAGGIPLRPRRRTRRLLGQSGRHQRARVSGSGYAAVPSWSPDGRQLAYLRAEAENPKVWNLWLLSLDPDAPKARRLTHYSYGQLWAASWFSDGRRILHPRRQDCRARSGERPPAGVRISGQGPSVPDSRGVAGRNQGHLSSVSPGRLAARPRDRVDAERPHRPVRGGVCVVTDWTPHRVSQPSRRRMGNLRVRGRLTRPRGIDQPDPI